MEYFKIIIGTENLKLNCLEQNDSFQVKTTSEKMSGGPLSTKAIIYAILSLKNTSVAQSNFDYMRMTLSEGKNRMIEQIDDANLMKDNELLKIRKESGKFLLQKVIDIVSEEVNLSYKFIQLIYLLESGLAVEFKNMFVLDERISEKLGNKYLEVNDFNKRANILLQKAITYIENETYFKSQKLEEDYLNNPEVTDNMKKYLKFVGTEWIRKSKSTNTIYKSFRRKAKMNAAQRLLLADFVIKIRQASRDSVSRDEILELFKLDPDYYKDNEVKALEPIDDLLESIITFGDSTETIEDDIDIDF